MKELPAHLKGSTFVIHVAGEKTLHKDDWAQYCVRCGGCLAVHPMPELEYGTLFPYMLGPDSRLVGAIPMSPELWEWGDVCPRTTNEEEST